MSAQTGNAVLLEVRKDLGLLQRELAERAGITHGYVCQIERGKRKIGTDAAWKIWCAYRGDFERLGFNFDDLILGKRQAA